MKNSVKSKLSAMAMALFALCAFADDPATGWKQTATGSYNYNDTANWVNGEVNGVFGSDLTFGASQTILFPSDWTGTLSVEANIGQKVLFWGSDGAKTFFVNGDLVLRPASMDSDFVFGDSKNTTRTLNFDLGGVDRYVAISGYKWIFNNRISNGGLVFDGKGTFTFRSAGGSSGAVTLENGATLGTSFTSDDNGKDFTGDNAITRAASLTLRRGTYYGNLSNVDAEENIPGMLTIDGYNGGNGHLQLRCNSKYDVLTFGGLARVNGGVLVVSADNLGADLAPGVQRVIFSTAPATVEGIIPGVMGASSYNSNVTGSSYDHTFVAYDAVRGLVPLAASEYVYSIPDGSTTANLRVAAGTTMKIAEAATVKSLFLEGGANLTTDTVIAGSGPLTVLSGQVMMQYNAKKSPSVEVPLDFGSTTGYFYYGYGKTSYLKGSVSGSGGLVFMSPMSVSSAHGKALRIESGTSGESTYTGDTYVNGGVLVGDVDFFPCGARTGNVYVNGYLQFHNKTINGLYGSGTVTTAYTSSNKMTIGDNDADGDFTGDITFATVNKIGTGTQRFGRMVTVTTLNVNAGSVVLDGALSGLANVAAGAALGGSGGITNNVTFADGAKLAVAVADDVASCLTVGGTVSGGSVTVNVDETGRKWRTAQCVLKSDAAITASFVKGEGLSRVELRNNDTELWATPKVSGFSIIIR